MLVLFIFCALALVYLYIGYPMLLGLAARVWGHPTEQGDELPGVTIIVAAHQERAVIQDKLDNFDRLDYPPEQITMLIVSDGSTDGTDEIVRAHSNPRIRLMRQEPRAGKASALNLALANVDAEVLVFTDANVLFEASAIRALVRHFADLDVGVVTGVVQLIDTKSGYAESEGAYYRYERFIQQAESRLHSVVGVDGALYAARRSLVSPPPRDAILDDFIISMEIACQGQRILYDDTARAVEDAAPDMQSEFRRKVRVAAGAYQSLLRGWGTPGIRTPWLTWCYWSHKVLRWCGPLLLAGCFVGNAALAPSNDQFASLFALQCLFYVLAVVGMVSPDTRGARTVAVPMYFTMMNAAFALGLWKYLRHGTGGSWKPTARTRLTGDPNVGEPGEADSPDDQAGDGERP